MRPPTIIVTLAGETLITTDTGVSDSMPLKKNSMRGTHQHKSSDLSD